MALAALIISVFALVAAGVSTTYTRMNARNSIESARLARKPRFTVKLDNPEFGGGVAFFSLLNDDQQDLDSVMIHPAKPDRPPGRVYLPERRVALMGKDFEDGAAEVGPLPMRSKIVFAVQVGAGRPDDDLLVRVVAKAGRARWESVERLRFPVDLTTQVH